MLPRLPWALLGALVLTQICYPLTSGGVRAGFTVLIVLLGYLLSVSHALLTRGARAAAALVATATLGGFAVEAVGVATGFPFGTYDYSGQLGPKLLGVPLIIPLAWTWMAWPAWLAAIRLVRGRAARILVAAAGLAAWDLFLDPQMVAEGYWRWRSATPALPGVPGIPIGNYLGWLGFAVLLMTVLAAAAGKTADHPTVTDAPIMALWLWTYASSVLAHAVFLGLPASAAWGGVIMGVIVLPLAVRLLPRPFPPLPRPFTRRLGSAEPTASFPSVAVVPRSPSSDSTLADAASSGPAAPGAASADSSPPLPPSAGSAAPQPPSAGTATPPPPSAGSSTPPPPSAGTATPPAPSAGTATPPAPSAGTATPPPPSAGSSTPPPPSAGSTAPRPSSSGSASSRAPSRRSRWRP
jgi:uncharacterized membrane protein